MNKLNLILFSLLIMFSTNSYASCDLNLAKFKSLATLEQRIKYKCQVIEFKHWQSTRTGTPGDVYIKYINGGIKNGGDKRYFRLKTKDYTLLPNDTFSTDSWQYVATARSSVIEQSIQKTIRDTYGYNNSIDLELALPDIFGTGSVKNWSSTGKGVPGDVYVTYDGDVSYYFQLKTENYRYMNKSKMSNTNWDFITDNIVFLKESPKTTSVIGNLYKIKKCNLAKMQNDYILTHTINGDTLYWFKNCNLSKTAEMPGVVSFAKQTETEMLAFINNRVRGTTEQTFYSFNSDGAEMFDSVAFRKKNGMFPHHDMLKTNKGTYMSIMQKVVGPNNSRDDIIVEFDSNGKILWQLSVNVLIYGVEDGAQGLAWGENWMHTNSLEQFPNGDLLISARNNNELIRITYPAGEVVWKTGSDVLGFQHHASVVNSDLILVYNNGIHLNDFANSETGIVAYNGNGNFLWEKKLGFRSDGYGSVELLENGNWLTIDGKGGRILEYSPDFSEVYFELEWIRENYLWWYSASPDRSANSLYRAQMVKQPFFE